MLAQIACLTAALSYAARRRLGTAVQGAWRVADQGRRRTIDRRRLCDGADRVRHRPALAPPLAAAGSVGGDRRAGAVLHRARLCALFQADRNRRRDQCAARHPAGPADRHPDGRPDLRRTADQRPASPASGSSPSGWR